MSFVSKWFGFGRDERYDRGIRAFEQGHYEEALEELKAVESSSSDPGTVRLARFYISECYSHLGQADLMGERFDDAVAQFRQAIDLHPHYPDLHLKLAQAYRGLGQRDAQAAALNRALQINPNYADAILQQGILLYEDGDYDAALAAITRAVELEPGLGGERYAFALECHGSGDTSRALANLVAMSSSDSSDANSHARVAASFAKQGLFQEAAQEYSRALQIAPRYADIRCRFGQVLMELDLLEPAEVEYREAIAINPNYADAWAHLGILLRRQKRMDESKEAFERAVEIDPHNVIAQDQLIRRQA